MASACPRRILVPTLQKKQNPVSALELALVPIRVRHLQLVFIEMSCPGCIGSCMTLDVQLPSASLISNYTQALQRDALRTALSPASTLPACPISPLPFCLAMTSSLHKCRVTGDGKGSRSTHLEWKGCTIYSRGCHCPTKWPQQ